MKGQDRPMTTRGPLAEPLPWNLVSKDYAIEVVPQFEKFAADALRVAGIRPGARVLDVAAGPGTLTLLAARNAKNPSSPRTTPLRRPAPVDGAAHGNRQSPERQLSAGLGTSRRLGPSAGPGA